jgi:uncharacterized protein YhbP (UPF0306 family)
MLRTYVRSAAGYERPVGSEHQNREVDAAALATLAERLLDASTLCAIATVTPEGLAHVNTAYFAWSPAFEIVWLSEPGARHSANLAANPSASVAVYDSRQSWGRADRGIQLFGSARELEEATSPAYERRFPAFRASRFASYRFYVLRPSRLKLFDETELGAATFVTARVEDGSLAWESTEVYRSEA